MKDIKIDLVYLWVNDKDKDWQKKKQYWANKLKTVNSEDNHYCRFSDNEELRYSLRSVEMYAPWINKIYIITDNMQPEWLNINDFGIKIIDHKDIMPKECLPTFNASALEACIDNIDGLSEYFLYANDDMFFSAPVQPDYFFDENNNPIIHLRKRNWTESDNTYMQMIINTTQLFQTKFKLDDILKNTEPSHCIDAYRKSYIKDCKKYFLKEFQLTQESKFRAENNVQRVIFSYYMLTKNLATLQLEPAWEEQEFCNNVDNLTIFIKPIEYMMSKIENLTPKLLCINDALGTCDEDRKKLKQLLYILYNVKPKWEKTKDYSIKPVFSKNFYTIVFAFNDKYCKYFSTALQSLISNSNPGENYDIIAFNTDIDEENKKLLYKMLPPNFSLRFFDMMEYLNDHFTGLKLITLNNWSVEMYYRIFIPFVMKSYEKVLYLDSDIVVDCNIGELFKIDFEGKEIIAVRDTFPQTINFCKKIERYEYIRYYLNLENEKNYFNSGMIFFNLKNINKEDYYLRVTKAFNLEKLFYPDQDILNVVFKNSTKFVSSKWNFCCGELAWNKNFLNLICGEYLKDYTDSMEKPKIIHYTSPRKPWNCCNKVNFDIFWKYARKSLFYESILYQMNKDAALEIIVESAKYTNLYMQLQNNKKILFWGASIFLENFINSYDIINDNILGIIDKNPNKRGKFIREYEIFSPQEIDKFDVDEIIITIVNNARERAVEIKDYIAQHCKNKIKIKTI